MNYEILRIILKTKKTKSSKKTKKSRKNEKNNTNKPFLEGWPTRGEKGSTLFSVWIKKFNYFSI